jgi:hypothetical protein
MKTLQTQFRDQTGWEFYPKAKIANLIINDATEAKKAVISNGDDPEYWEADTMQLSQLIGHYPSYEEQCFWKFVFAQA